MSTIEYHGSETRTVFRDHESVDIQPQRRNSVRAMSGTFTGSVAGAELYKFNPARRVPRTKAFRGSVRTKRRLKGFLVELPVATQNQEARVAFIENGETILYNLPAEPIRKAGITLLNQPFEMDEIETEGEDGSFTVSYRYKALAMPADAYIQTLNFDDERKRKRDLILKAFGKTQD